MNGREPGLEILNDPGKTVSIGAQQKDVITALHEKVNRLVLNNAFGALIDPGHFVGVLELCRRIDWKKLLGWIGFYE